MAGPGASVPTDAVLDCLAGLLRAHSAPRTGGPLVLPVILAERSRWTPLLTAAMQQEGVLVVDATLCGHGVRCGDLDTDAPVLRTEIQALLDRYNSANAGADLTLQVDSDTANITGSTDYASANTGQRALRETLTACCHEDLRAADLAVLIMAEDALEAQQVEEVWRFLMRLPSILNLPRVASLVVVAGDSRANPGGVHFRGDPSVRYLLGTDGLRTRRPQVENREAIAELRSYGPEDFPLFALFLGAGASAGAGLVTGNTLRDQALEHLMGEAVTSDTADEVAGRWFERLAVGGHLTDAEQRLGRDSFVSTLTLERVLAREQAIEGRNDSYTLRQFRRSHDKIVEALTQKRLAGDFDDDPLVKLLSARKRIVLVTVNFDRVIEAKGGDAVRPFITEEDLEALPDYLDDYREHGGAVPLVKVHGDIWVPDSMVANLDQTQAGLSHGKAQALDRLIAEVVPLVVEVEVAVPHLSPAGW
jgi:hypothetical protein